MFADQQAQLAEELAPRQVLLDQVFAKIQGHRALQDHVHAGARVAADEQPLARYHRTRAPDLREQFALFDR